MKKLHILIIIAGTLFILLGAFHTNIWFDEAYTCGMINNSFFDIWKITGNDVHPVLYYWMLKIVSLFLGNSILVYRLFSAVAIILLAILGYTHIKKDFDEKTGIIFSFLTLFLPAMAIYAMEIRMYSWAMLFVTLTTIYAYRISKENTIKNWIIFAICSLSSCYIHYYGLMAAGIINMILLIYILKDKNRIKEYLKTFIIVAIIQVILYIPWLIYFVTQLKHVSGGFWIGIAFPDTLIELVNTQYIGSLKTENMQFLNYIVFGMVVGLYVYIGYLVHKELKKKENIVAILLSIRNIFISYNCIFNSFVSITFSYSLLQIFINNYRITCIFLIVFYGKRKKQICYNNYMCNNFNCF